MDSNERYLRKNIGRKIKLARSRTNYTQEKLAEKLILLNLVVSVPSTLQGKAMKFYF